MCVKQQHHLETCNRNISQLAFAAVIILGSNPNKIPQEVIFAMFSECPIFSKKVRVEGDGQSVSCCCNLILFTENTRYFKQGQFIIISFSSQFFLH